MIAVATEDFFTLDTADILADPKTGLPQVTWEKTTIKNVIDLFFDYNVPGLRKDDFGRRQVYTADDSVRIFNAESAIKMEARGIRSSYDGQSLMDRFALGYMERWGYGVWILTIATTYRRHPLEILDSVRITHPLIENPLTSQRGLMREQFEILNVTPQWLTEGKVVLQLMFTGGIETSATPTTTGGLSLVPGIGTTDETDLEIPLGGSADVNSEPGTSKLIVGLKRTTYRHWQCQFSVFAYIPPDSNDKGGTGTCSTTASPSFVNRSYTSGVTYRLEYKTSAAPDAPGTGTDPTTGWVPLKASTTRGNVSMQDEKKCFNPAADPTLPTEETWSENFEVLAAAPATYDVRVFWDSVDAQADPCGTISANYCSPLEFCPGLFVGSTLRADVKTMSIDYLTSIA